MSQKRLDKLALLSIIKEILNKINYDNLINILHKKSSKNKF